MAFEFLQKVFSKCDKLTTLKGEGLDNKIWQMAKESGHWDYVGRSFVKWFMAYFRHNNEKFHVIVNQDSISVPAEIEEETPEDDLYLVKAAIISESPILTTDRRLKERLSHREELTIHLLDEFLDNYDC